MSKYDHEFWKVNAPLSGVQLGEKLGINDGNARRLIRKAKQKEENKDLPWFNPIDNSEPTSDDMPRYKESMEMLADKSYRSDKLIKMDENQCKSERYMLEAHGFDPKEWTVVTAKNTAWTGYSKLDGDKMFYSSKITVKPLVGAFDLDAIVAAITDIRPVLVPKGYTKGNRLLEISPVDMHFGIADYDDYASSLSKIVELIQSERWKEIIILVGSDMLHHDNFESTTVKGTIIENIDYPKAWESATRFYSVIIEAALAHGVLVKILYIPGNHDASMSWAFTHMLKAKYPQAEFDLSIAERRIHRFEQVCIGFTHGDKGKKKDLDRVFLAEFPEFATADTKEIHIGHTHHEETIDQNGVVIRTLSTKAPTDTWHQRNGFIGSKKRFMVFEYNPNELETVHYV